MAGELNGATGVLSYLPVCIPTCRAHPSTNLSAQLTERAASALARAPVEVVELLMRQSASLRKWNQTKPVTSGCFAG